MRNWKAVKQGESLDLMVRDARLRRRPTHHPEGARVAAARNFPQSNRAAGVPSARNAVGHSLHQV